MIIVKLNKPEFEYDIHSLVKAFFPEENVSVTAEEKHYDEPASWMFRMDYREDGIAVEWRKNGEEEPAGQAYIAADFTERKEAKNQLKQGLYRILSGMTGKELPWGTLTGIRPTKIPMKLLEEGQSKETIRSYMKDTYFASDEKIELSIEIAERELDILKQIDYENGYSLYIGIPFCPTTCLYCSFTSFPLVTWRAKVDAYLDAVERELDYVAVKFGKKHLNSIYIGGGTPTTLEPYQLDRLIRKIHCSFDLSDCKEVTVEAGKETITFEKSQVALVRLRVEF